MDRSIQRSYGFDMSMHTSKRAYAFTRTHAGTEIRSIDGLRQQEEGSRSEGGAASSCLPRHPSLGSSNSAGSRAGGTRASIGTYPLTAAAGLACLGLTAAAAGEEKEDGEGQIHGAGRAGHGAWLAASLGALCVSCSLGGARVLLDVRRGDWMTACLSALHACFACSSSRTLIAHGTKSTHMSIHTPPTHPQKLKKQVRDLRTKVLGLKVVNIYDVDNKARLSYNALCIFH